MMPPPLPNSFRRRLEDLRRGWQHGLFVATFFRCAALFLTILLVYGFIDFWLGLEVPWRVVATIAVATILVRATWRWLGAIFKLSLSDMGRRADTLLGSHRHSILSAHELQVAAAKETTKRPFNEFLVARLVNEAKARLNHLSQKVNYPSGEIFGRVKIATALLLFLLALIWWQPRATRTILARVFRPLEDLAPYSHYAFHVAPSQPRALYGGTLDIAVEITGGPVTDQVWFVTRRDGKVERTPCFQESPQRFAQKVENITEPIEFCFETGRSRCNWYTVNVLMQPHITLAHAIITPPAYAHKPSKSLFIGQENLAVLKDSMISLSVTSNRPLEHGTLTQRASNNPANESVVSGNKSGEHTVTFTWKAETTSSVEVVVSDVQGAKSPEPLKFAQKIIPDEPPSVMLTDPPPFLLATPDAILSFHGRAEDDLGLQRVEFVRNVIGYRERARVLEVHEPQLNLDFAQDLPLEDVGVQPGDVLEFYLEATDTNPSLMGVTTSDTVRVQIISKEEYADQIRARTTVEEFAARYDLANEKFDNAKKALEELQKTASDKNAKPEEIEKSLQKARQSMADAINFFDALQKDFAAFDSDNSLKKTSGEIAASLKQSAKKLDETSASDPNLASTAGELARQMDVPQQQLDNETRKGRDIERVSRLMESAQRLSQLVRSQENLVNRIERRGDDGWQYPLDPLAERQSQLREELDQLAKDIDKQSRDLPPGEEYRELAASAQKAAKKINDLKIAGEMQSGVDAGKNQDRSGADVHGSEALKRLKSLLSSCNGSGFGGLCDGKIKFSPRGDVRSALQQMSRGLCRRFGHGKDPGGAGEGPGGYDEDGYWVGNMSPIAVPVYGPMRIGMHPAEDSSARGHQANSTAAVAPLLDANSSSQVAPTNKDKPHGEALVPEDLPEKYRSSILLYFSPEPAKPNPQP